MAAISFSNKSETKGTIKTKELGVIKFQIKKSATGSNFGLFLDGSNQAMTRKNSKQDCLDYLKAIINNVR